MCLYETMVLCLSEFCVCVCVCMFTCLLWCFVHMNVHHDKNEELWSWYDMCMFEITSLWTRWCGSWFCQHANLLTYLLTSLLSCSQTDNLPCMDMHTYVMIPVIWSGTIMLVAFITTTYCYDQYGSTAMIKAAAKGHKGIVEYLVSQGADKDIKNNVSTTLVHEHLYKMIYLYICIDIDMHQ